MWPWVSGADAGSRGWVARLRTRSPVVLMMPLSAVGAMTLLFLSLGFRDQHCSAKPGYGGGGGTGSRVLVQGEGRGLAEGEPGGNLRREWGHRIP